MSRESTVERVFKMIEAAAVIGARCPQREQLSCANSVLKDLAMAGRIRIEIYKLNFRRVTILSGPRAGMSTADPPLDHHGKAPKPFMVSDTAGTRRNGALVKGWVGARPTMMFKDGKRVR